MLRNREARELQNLRQRQASNVIQIDPNLRGFTSRFNQDDSRARLLQAQRSRVPTREELEKSVGVKTAKKLKKRRGKNLRGETARNIREQRRFERGERRDRPEQEPRIVGDPVAGAAAAEDPALQRRRLDLEEARDRQAAFDRAAQRRADQATQERELAVRRGELAGARADRAAARLAGPPADPEAQLRLAIEGRRITAQDAQQRRLVEALGEERGERERLLGAAQGERGDLRQEVRFNLAQAVQERGRIGALREAERREEREERELLAERGDRDRRRDREARTEDAVARAAADVARDERERAERIRLGVAAGTERTELGERAERLGAEERAERLQREAQRTAEGTSRDRERRQESAQAHEERIEIIDRLTREQDLPDPVAEEDTTGADRDFLQRQFERGLDTIDRRIGESEARTAEQIRLHADRVSQRPERQDPTINIYNPVQPPLPPAPSERRPSQTAEDIARRVRQELEEVLSPRGREEIERERRPEPPRAAPFTEQRLPTPPTSPRPQPPPSRSRSPTPPRQVREDQPEGQIRVSGGDVDPFARDPTQDDFSQGGARQTAEVEPADLPTDFDRPFGPIQGDEDFLGLEPEPEALPPVPPEDIFQSQQFAGDLEALAQNAIGFVGDVAGGAIGGIRGLFEAQPEIGEQTGGALVGPEGNPIFGLGQEIEPTIQPLQSDAPRRRAYVGRDPRTGPPSQTLEQFQAERRERLVSPESSEASFGSFLGGIETPSPQSSPERENPPRLEPVGQETLSPAAPKKETSLEESLRVAQSELSALQRRQRSAGQSSRGRAQASRSSGSLAGTKFARKSGGVPPADLERAEERVRNLQGLVSVQRDQERIRRETERAREAGAPRQGFTTGGAAGLVEEEDESEAQADVGESGRRTNFQLYESIAPEIESSYTRGRAQGGARGSLPFIITNTTDKKFKGLEPGQSATIDQVERDGTLGYYPRGQVMGVKAGITRIQKSQLEKQIKAGKLKVDRVR